MNSTCFKSDADLSDFSDTASTSTCSETESPVKYKTEMCRNWLQGYCAFGTSCNFAHGHDELRNKQNDEKPCQHFFQHGYCLYGVRCQFSHARLNFEHKRAKVRVSVPQFVVFV
mmetsp:Transcript_12190/g.23130  ORF Transcript_12190/g.23130 Transcript_12190/m.23130 type:complete len:114 (-) Transcript_12190:418-759(-)